VSGGLDVSSGNRFRKRMNKASDPAHKTRDDLSYKNGPVRVTIRRSGYEYSIELPKGGAIVPLRVFSGQE